MYALAFIPLVAFWAALTVAFQRPRHNYVGGNRVWLEAIRAYTLFILDLTAGIAAVGRAARQSLPGVLRFAAAMQKIQAELDKEAVRAEWEL